MASKVKVGSVFFDIQTNSGAFTKGIRSAASSAQSVMSSAMGNVGKYIATAFSATAVVAFGKKCVKVASETQSAWKGLSSILNGQGKSFSQANDFIQSYIKDGLVPLNNAVSSYKNLASRGYSTEQIENVMLALKDSAAFGRQASYSYGEAIQTATEGLKNENSILVDNAGVTKNVAKMWEEYAQSIGTTRDKLTDTQKITAEVNGIIAETKWQTGDAAKYADSFAGKVAKLSASYTTFKTSIGEAVMPIVNLFLPAVQSAINGATRLANAMKSVLSSLGFEVPDISSYTNTATSALRSAQAVEQEGNAIENAAKKAKKAKGAFAAFDEINVLNKSTSSSDSSDTSSSSAGESAASSGVVNTALKINEETQSVFSSMFDPFVLAWENKGSGVIASAKEAFFNLSELLTSIKTSFSTVFENGTGQITLETFLSITKNIFDTVGNVAFAFKNAWNNAGNGTQFIQNVSNSTNNLLCIVESVGRTISDWWKSDSGTSFANTTVEMFTKISGGVERVTLKIRQLWEGGGKDVFNNLLTGFGNIGEIIEIVSGYLSDFYADLVDWFAPDVEMGIADVNDSLTTFNNLLDWLKTDGKPILETVAYAIGIVTSAMFLYKGVTTAVKIATTAFSTAQTIANAVMNANPVMLIVAGITALIAVIILCIKHWDEIKAAFKRAFDYMNEKATAFEESFSQVCESIRNFFSEKITEIETAFKNARIAIKAVFSNVGSFFSGIWNTIKSKFSDVKTFFKNAFTSAWTAIKNVFSNVGSFFSGIWNTIKSKFTDIGTKIGESVSGAFKNAINSVLATIEKTLNTPINAINNLLDIINKVPGISISKLSTFSLPRLYNGGWFSANNPTLSIVGDNKHEGEIVTPESKIREQVEKALSKFKGVATQTVQTVKLAIELIIKYPDGRTVIKQINEAQIKEGRILLEL